MTIEMQDLIDMIARDADLGATAVTRAVLDRRALLAEVKELRAKLAAVEALCDRAQMHDHDGFKTTYVSWIRKALDGAS